MAQVLESDRISGNGLSMNGSMTNGVSGGSTVVTHNGRSCDKTVDDEYSLGPLPPMWEKAFTPTGEVYFIDHNTGTSHWLDPRLARVRKHSLGECGEDELPYGWERVTDERYGSYYVDHINRKTQYENPVLQARRLRAEKLVENDSRQTNGMVLTGELRGERFTQTIVKSSQGLGFTLVAAEGVPEMEGYLQVRNIVPHSPAWIDGALRPGDVLVGVGVRGVRGLTHSQVAQMFQCIPPGSAVQLHLLRGYPLTVDSDDPNTRVLSTLAVDNSTSTNPDAVAMQQLTRALRTRFNLDSPSHMEPSPGMDETDNSPVTLSPGQRRLLSRSFDLDEIPTTETSDVPPRCPSADHLLTLASDDVSNEGSRALGQELAVSLRRGAAGFGFTIADSVHGQKVKKVLDRGRCAGLREGDLLLQIGEVDVSRAPHHRVVQVLKECPSMRETTIRVWRRGASRAPRSRSATRPQHTPIHNNVGRSKTPTAEQLRSQGFRATDSMQDSHSDMHSVEAMYAVPEHKGRESLAERRRRSAPGPARLALPPDHAHDRSQNHWNESSWVSGGEWGGQATPTVRICDSWPTRADSSDNGGFPEDNIRQPTTAAVCGLQDQKTSMQGIPPHSPSNSGLRSQSPSTASATDRLLPTTPTRLHSQSPSNHSSSGRVKASPIRTRDSPGPRRPPSCCGGENQHHTHPFNHHYTQCDGDRAADVVVRVGRGAAGFGFRIVGGVEDGSRVAVGYVVPGGPAEGLLRPGDLLTSVDGEPLAGATHARAVAAVCRAAARGHVTLGVRHNRADIQPMAHNPMAAHHNNYIGSEIPVGAMGVGPYNLVHPAPLYPPSAHMPMYGAPYENALGAWSAGVPYDVAVTRGPDEGFGFVVISSTNKATSTIGQLIPNSPAAKCGLLHVGDTLLAINHIPIRNLPHPEVVALIKHSGNTVTLTILSADGRVD